MTPESVRRLSLRAMIACSVVAVLCVLIELLVRGHPITTKGGSATTELFEIALAGALLAAAVYRKVPKWMEDRLGDVDRPGARPGQPPFSWIRFAVETLLPICAVLGLLVPIGLLSLVLNHGKPLTGGEFTIVELGVPWAAITAVDAFFRYRRSIRSGNATAWDRAALLTAPTALLVLGVLFLGPSRSIEALPREHPWMTSLLSTPFLFLPAYAIFRTERKPRYTSRRAHPNASVLRRDHA